MRQMGTQTGGRIASIDFWRGAVLIMIFVDHVPWNPYAQLTMRNFAFPDATEAFIFVSGLVLAYVCWPKLESGAFQEAVRRCLKRAGELYWTHIGLTVAALALFGAAYALGGPDMLIERDNRALAFEDPARAAVGILVLGYQIGYFNILPIYVVLLLMAPFLLWLTHRNVLWGLGASVLIYIAARNGLRLPSWPNPHNWFLNPFAWQLIFTIGMACGMALRGRGVPYSRPVMIGSVAIVVLSFLYMRGWLPGAAAIRPFLDTGKGELGLGRLVNFLALAYIVGQIGVADTLLKLRGAHWLVRLGRQALPIFAAGSLLSAAFTIPLFIFQAQKNQLAFDLTTVFSIPLGIILLLGLTRYLEWRKEGASQRPARAVSARGVAGWRFSAWSYGRRAQRWLTRFPALDPIWRSSARMRAGRR